MSKSSRKFSIDKGVILHVLTDNEKKSFVLSVRGIIVTFIIANIVNQENYPIETVTPNCTEMNKK